MSYKVIGSGQRRHFEITFGLTEGYGPEGIVHSMEDVKNALHDWMRKRISCEAQFLTGTLMPGEVVYAWPAGNGEAGTGSEGSASFIGEVSVLYSANLTDDEVVTILNDLASFVGERLGQTRVYVSYMDEAWVLEKEGGETPSGD